MADTFEVITQYPTLEFLGGTQTQDVMAVGYRTKAHGVYYEVRIPRSTYSAEQVHDYGIGYTGTIESVLSAPGVIGGEWTQTPTSSGELRDNLVITVQSDSGNSTAQLTVPFSQLAPTLTAPKVAHLVDQLNAAEGL